MAPTTTDPTVCGGCGGSMRGARAVQVGEARLHRRCWLRAVGALAERQAREAERQGRATLAGVFGRAVGRAMR